jgi:hypothetical protein
VLALSNYTSYTLYTFALNQNQLAHDEYSRVIAVYFSTRLSPVELCLIKKKKKYAAEYRIRRVAGTEYCRQF